MTGIYKISSIINPKRHYIGSAVNIKYRWQSHKSGLLRNKHKSSKLQNHCNKYGFSDLVFEIVEEFEFSSKQHLLEREQYYIDLEKPFFNHALIAGSPSLGIKFTELHKLRISLALKSGNRDHSHCGKYITKEGRETLRLKGLNQVVSDATKLKQRNAKLGRNLSPDHKEKIRLKCIGNKSRTGFKESKEHIVYRMSKIKDIGGSKKHKELRIIELHRKELRQIEASFSTKTLS